MHAAESNYIKNSDWKKLHLAPLILIFYRNLLLNNSCSRLSLNRFHHHFRERDDDLFPCLFDEFNGGQVLGPMLPGGNSPAS